MTDREPYLRVTDDRLLVPKVQNVLVINENWHVEFTHPMPNPWRRFWYWVLLGWRWSNGHKSSWLSQDAGG